MILCGYSIVTGGRNAKDAGRIHSAVAIPIPQKDDAIAAKKAAFRDGDKGVWRDVLSQWGPRLLNYARRMLGAGQDSQAQDVVQDSLVSALKAAKNFRGDSSIKAWLFRIVHRRAVDVLREQKRFVALPASNDDGAGSGGGDGLQFNGRGRWAEQPERVAPSDLLDAKRMLAMVRMELDHLPHIHRQVLLLKEVVGLDTDELCEALEITPANVRVTLHRARKALRARVAKASQAGLGTPTSCSADEFRASLKVGEAGPETEKGNRV